jgi:hypothetical protein
MVLFGLAVFAMGRGMARSDGPALVGYVIETLQAKPARTEPS